jgi:hypothetical protein
MKTRLIAAGMLVVLCAITPIWADITADFENYIEGSLGTQFTDPHSGFHFDSNVGPGTPGEFVIDYESGDPFLPQVHSNYLGTDALCPGAVLCMGGGKPFSITFPIPTRAVWMDIIYQPSPGNTLILTGLDARGQNVAQFTHVLETLEKPWAAQVGLSSPFPFTQLVITPPHDPATATMYIDYDNITIPEPATVTILLLGSAIVLTPTRRGGRWPIRGKKAISAAPSPSTTASSSAASAPPLPPDVSYPAHTAA